MVSGVHVYAQLALNATKRIDVELWCLVRDRVERNYTGIETSNLNAVGAATQCKRIVIIAFNWIYTDTS